MSTEGIGLVCRSCRHFNVAFSMQAPETVSEMHAEAKSHARPETCGECGASLLRSNLEPESERRRVAAQTARIKQEAVRRAWGGGGGR